METMNESVITHPPKLLKARQLHSRLFAVAAVALVLVTQPVLEPHALLRQLMLWTGYALVTAGAFGRVYCSAFIGGRKNDVVVRDGPFSVVRNPLYVFSFIATVGIGLQSGMGSLTLLLAGAYAWYYPKVVAKEEAFLTDKFGPGYEAYVHDVPRWIPDMKLWKESEQVDAKPKFMRKTAMDAAIFFIPLPCFYLIALLQAQHMLPVWLTLP